VTLSFIVTMEISLLGLHIGRKTDEYYSSRTDEQINCFKINAIDRVGITRSAVLRRKCLFNPNKIKNRTLCSE